MKATIGSVIVEGTPKEIVEYERLKQNNYKLVINELNVKNDTKNGKDFFKQLEREIEESRGHFKLGHK